MAIHRHSPGHLKGITLARRFDLENVGALNVGEQLDPKFRHSETYRDKGRDQLLSLLVIRRTSVGCDRGQRRFCKSIFPARTG